MVINPRLSFKSAFKNPLEISIPKIKIIGKQFADVLTKSEEIGLSLNQIAQAMKTKKKVYSNSISKLTADLGYIANSDLNKTLKLTILGTFVIATIALLLSIRNYYALVLLARPVHVFDWWQPTPTPTASDPTDLELLMALTKIIACSMILVCILILLKCMLSCLKLINSHKMVNTEDTKASCELAFTMYNRRELVTTKLKRVPISPSEINVYKNMAFEKPQLSRHRLFLFIRFD